MDELGVKILGTMDMLKDFQRATVERVDWLFEHGQNRVLVADEVGMGKTMVAKGTIALMAKQLLNSGKKNFKVIYVCSNQSIANQNISELDVFNAGHENIMDTRLSMQHFLIEKTKYKNDSNFIQLIPLTPQTSFNQQNSSQGMVQERALIFCILSRMDLFQDERLHQKLEQLLMFGVKHSNWDWRVRDYNKEIDILERKPGSDYPIGLHLKILDDKIVLEQTIDYLIQRPFTTECERAKGDRIYISYLRKLFARISVGQLQPDLVILDEFQNFRFLLNSNDDEIKTLTDCFFGNKQTWGTENHVTRVLLLSATPYKLYTTLEEIGDNNLGDHYGEFMDVMRFLYNKDERFKEFSHVWQSYSTTLKEIKSESSALLLLSNKVKEAENELYGAVARTERLSVMNSGDYIDDRSKHSALRIKESDIRSYVQARELMAHTEDKNRFRVDYIKSCPFALSFMNNYSEKRNMRIFFTRQTENLRYAQKDLLWVDKKKINKYQPLPAVNARFEQLKENIFTNRSELLLWMPPCYPYYTPTGIYAGQEQFSKILVFSAWEMVPRMIGSLISYEEERRTIGELIKRHKDKIDEQSQLYFIRSSQKKKRTRYPAGRLKPSIRASLSLIYPGRKISGIYNPISYLNAGVLDINTIESSIRKTIHSEINKLVDKYGKKEGNKDRKWYYLAPMLMDDPDYVVSWMNCLGTTPEEDDESTEIESEGKSFGSIINTVRRYFVDEDGRTRKKPDVALGRIPDDLESVLISMAMASPAICLLRALKKMDLATRIARDFVRYFNSPESTAIVELSFSKRGTPSEDSHWLDVLNYCKMGNFQSMIDEFIHLLRNGHPIEERLEKIENRFHECLTLHSSPYNVESFKEFSQSIKEGKSGKSTHRIRTHYGAGFTKGDSTDKTIARKDNLRNAFNSPFWPFVLASTSIGQEGLDFHLYCRKIMHWNLPSNAIDLEQREGRINRYKCLAIRQNVARKYGIKTNGLTDDCWEGLFHAAVAERREGQSELIPYWCFGENQDVKIERLLPLYPISKDQTRYDRLIKILSLYRLTLGQTRQEDLLEHIFNHFENPEILKNYFIDLSPFSHQSKDKNNE